MTIAIFGLFDQQQRFIEREYGQRFKLRFMGTRPNPSIPPSTDIIIFSTRFCRHVQRDALDRAKVLYNNGGMSQLRKLLNSLMEKTE